MSLRSETLAALASLTTSDREALGRYVLDEGRNWRATLRTLWMLSALDRHPDGAALKRVRNVVGPTLLNHVQVADLPGPSCPVASVEDHKVAGRYRIAGTLDFAQGGDGAYGCHYGMRSTREAAVREFQEGFYAAERARNPR